MRPWPRDLLWRRRRRKPSTAHPYRTPPPAPALDRWNPIPALAALLVFLGSLLGPSSCCLATLDFGHCAEGSRIGLGSRTLFGALAGVALVCLLVVLLAWRWTRPRGRSMAAFVLGHVAAAALFIGGADTAVYELRWAHRCARGEGRACGALGNLYLHKRHDVDRARPFWRMGCELGDSWSCEAVSP
jgi:hypothetical protein